MYSAPFHEGMLNLCEKCQNLPAPGQCPAWLLAPRTVELQNHDVDDRQMPIENTHEPTRLMMVVWESDCSGHLVYTLLVVDYQKVGETLRDSWSRTLTERCWSRAKAQQQKFYAPHTNSAGG